jgi:hypothetical protein
LIGHPRYKELSRSSLEWEKGKMGSKRGSREAGERKLMEKAREEEELGVVSLQHRSSDIRPSDPPLPE